MGSSGHFEFVVAEGPSAGRRLRTELRQWLLVNGINGLTGEGITSAVTEAFNNAVEHPVDRATGQVVVKGDLNRRELVMRVCDHGRWKETVDPTQAHYGQRLMKAQMDSVRVERSVAGTVVTLRRTI